MAYFLPSFFQKRLLRYALSRLELVDTEALDLDSLGIRWGQRSTVELRDIGLRLEKLANLLHLPPSSELLSARARFLQITVPADIYSSGIICEASGIEVHLKLHAEDPQNERKPSTAAQEAATDDQILPTPNDLAKSFLQEEPEEEKDELQAAISSRSQVLQQTASTTSLSDDEDELGLGNESLSLPSFVAAFLKGVADRLQVRVSDIAIRIDTEMRQDGPSKKQPEETPDLVTAVLSVREVKMDGDSETSPGKRLVSLSDMNMALVSDPVVFSNYSRFAAPPSPAMTQSKSSQPPSSRAPSPPLNSSDHYPDLAMTQSTIFEKPRRETSGPEKTPEPERAVPQMEQSAYTHDGRFSDADSEVGNKSDDYLQDSQNLADDDDDDGILDNPAYLDSVIDLQADDDDIEGSTYPLSREEQSLVGSEGTPRPSSPQLYPSQSMPREGDLGEAGIGSDERDSLPGSRIHPQADERADLPTDPPGHHAEEPPRDDADADRPRSRSRTPTAPSEAGSVDSHSGSSNEELSESKIFGHEEAQSMYMSAFSEWSASKSFRPTMPGAWDFSESADLADRNARVSSPRVEEQEDSASTPKLTGKSEPLVLQEQEQSFHERSLGPGSEQSEREPEPSQSVSDLNKFTGVAKRFFSVDKVLLWLPSADRAREESQDISPKPHRRTSVDLNDSTAHLQESRDEDDLLTSGIYASTRLRSDSAGTSFRPRNTETNTQRHTREQRSDVHDKHAIAVEVLSVEVQFDIATGWLLAKMGQRVIQAFGGSDEEQTPHPRKKGRPSRGPQGRQAVRFSLNKLSMKFVEHLHGKAYPVDKSEPLSSSPPFGSSIEDIVLQVTASGLQAHLATERKTTDIRLGVSKFGLGFASESLISFDEGLKMRESTRDILAPTHGDISFSLSKSPEAARVNLTTLPLQVNFSIQRLEEVLGFLGGLSTILELGSSISSVSTVKGAKPEPPKKPRGVHFEAAPPPASVQPDDSIPWKVNARVGGIVLDVISESHYLKLRTTALKVVSRCEGIGMQVDKAKLSGPFTLNNSIQKAPAKVSLSNIRVEYLLTPKEVDLDRLLALITPSKDKYDEDDDIMLDTLFRQRRQGSVLRATVAGAKIDISRPGDLDSISQLGNELSRISSVAKYLPEDDRPGLLTLVLVRDLESRVHVGGQVGDISAHLRNTETAYISIPSLVAAQVGTIAVVRNDEEELLGQALPLNKEQSPDHTPLPVLMARFIADEMEPAVKIKLHNLRAEYTIPSIMAFLGLNDEMTRADVASNMANSVANFAEGPSPEQVGRGRRMSEEKNSSIGSSPQEPVKPMRLAVDMRDCIIGLNPRNSPARGLAVLTNAKFSGTIHDPESSEAKLDLRKASVMVIDEVQNVGYAENVHQTQSTVPQSNQVQSLIDMGYVPVSSISAATATVRLLHSGDDGTKSLDVELRDDLLILETCADSTQTLISIVNGLQPPIPQSDAVKYRTEVMPIQDMLASFSGDAFTADPVSDSEGSPEAPMHAEDESGGIEDELEYVSDFYPAKPGARDDNFVGMSSSQTAASESNDLLDSFHSQYQISSSFSDLDFQSDHFAKQSAVGGTAHRWDSTQNTYGLSNDSKVHRSPMRIRVRDAHVIWNLFDGYDWQRTRDTISKAVKDVEKKASERRGRAGGGSRMSPGLDEEEESVIGDCLFNSIYIGIPANKDPRDIRNDINRNIDDLVSETGSYATTTTVTGNTSRPSHSPSLRGKKLRLSRSKYHKMTFELKGICADFVVFPPDSEETQSSLDVRVNDLEIFDHVATSTWKKFATYMHEAGEKESGTSMIHLEILTVKPVPELAASEIVLKATILPVRLHVDQDALDFLCRFFEFRDGSEPTPPSPGEVPFLQRAEVNSVPVKLDFKPKRVDYAGLRSGRTTEFMNFFVLDNADMVLRHVIIYGISGFDKLGQTLNDIWMPDVKRNQLPGVLAGLAPIRSLVNVGGGVKDLVVVPMREYQKDGRIVRSIQRGAISFAKTTSNELVKLGAKLAIGTQTVLQGAEDLLSAPTTTVQTSATSTAAAAATTDLASPTSAFSAAGAAGLNEEDLLDEEEAKKISLYADQPVGVVQGLRGAFTGLERDLLLTRDAIVAVPGEVVDSGSPKAAARAVWKRAPTVVLRPAIGVSKAVGQTLLGAGNTLDPANRRRMEDKYKRH